MSVLGPIYKADFVLSQAKYFSFCLVCNTALDTHFSLSCSVVIGIFSRVNAVIFFSIASQEAEILLVA